VAQNPQAYDRSLVPLLTTPGVKRDGTDVEDDYFTDGEWIRFYRGKPRKMGGYRTIKNSFIGPIRAIHTRGRLLTSWHPSGMDYGELDDSGSLANFANATMPGGFAGQSDYTWQVDSIYNSASTNIVLVAHPGRNLNDINNQVDTDVIYATVNQSTYAVASFANAGKQASGGIVVLQPYVFAFGNKGEISNSDLNKPATWVGGDANTANVAGTKFVRGLSIKGGTGAPAGLFWSLDSLVRVSFVGGTALFRYDTLTSQSSILSPNSVIEYDGIYYWVGVDRFLMFNGVVREVPNQLNLDYFFDNLNFARSQRVWALKVPRYGEIWWFYPVGHDDECTQAVIYNVRANTWYDAKLKRSAGMYTQTSRFPVMADAEVALSVKKLVLTGGTGVFFEGDTITAGSATGSLVRSTLAGGAGELYVKSNASFPGSGAVTSSSGGAATISSSTTADLFRVWLHEFGRDRVDGDVTTSIPASYETQEFGLASGASEGQMGTESMTELSRVEPDFAGQGRLSITLRTRDYAQSTPVNAETKDCVIGQTPKLDFGKQGRYLTLRVECNEVGSHFQSGTPKVTMKKGSRAVPG
jgi:hypothetical protein